MGRNGGRSADQKYDEPFRVEGRCSPGLKDNHDAQEAGECCKPPQATHLLL